MAVAGIVAEYNPFHLGHAYHLAQTRAALGRDGAVVCVMSGHWVQRGECAAADKWTRSALALAGGADLVLELPTPWAMASAEAFARGAVGLLEATGVVDILSFGSEDGSLEALRQAADALDSPGYPARLREALGHGLSFPAARQTAADCPCLSSPNNNLGVEYLRALRALGSAMTPMTVARRGAGHDSTGHMEGFASASHIRALLREGRREEAAALLPDGSLEALGQPASLLWAERAILARLRTMEEAHWAALPDGGGAEGLPARLVRAARQACSLEEFYTLAKTRRYTHARLRRLALAGYLGLRGDLPQLPPYLRLLGGSEAGLAGIPGRAAGVGIPVSQSLAKLSRMPGDAGRVASLEARAGALWSLCLRRPRAASEEFTEKFIRV